jgi:DNA polymerase (family 10)
MSVEALRRVRARAVPLVLTSDAHHAQELERIRFAALNAERASIDPERVINTWPKERLLSWLETGAAGTL